MNKILSATLALVASLFVFSTISGCTGETGPAGRDGVNGHDGKDGQDACQAPDPTFWLIIRDFEEAARYSAYCFADTEAQYDICLVTYKPDDFPCMEAGDCNTYCLQVYNQNYNNCLHYTAWRANKTITRLCGAKVWTYTPPDELPGMEFGTLTAVDEDTDGDGISNFNEYLLHLNPCDTHSYGSCVKDSELDGDFDEVPNGKDDLPYCNPGDKENISDCI